MGDVEKRGRVVYRAAVVGGYSRIELAFAGKVRLVIWVDVES